MKAFTEKQLATAARVRAAAAKVCSDPKFQGALRQFAEQLADVERVSHAQPLLSSAQRKPK